MTSKMPAELEKAFAYRLPNGKTVGEASPDDWQENAAVLKKEAERIHALDPATMTEQDCQRLQAAEDRLREFDKAMEVIEAHLDEAGLLPDWFTRAKDGRRA